MGLSKAHTDYSTNSSIANWIDDWDLQSLEFVNDLDPQSSNLFCLGRFGQYDTDASSKQGDGTMIDIDAQFRIRKIQMPEGVSLDIETDKLTHLPRLKGASYNWEVTIDWIEDVYHNVYFYHTEWQKCWYNRVYDTLTCGVKGKFRFLDVIGFHYKAADDDVSGLVKQPTIEPVLGMRIAGMVPIKIPGITFDYYSDNNDAAFSVTYKCSVVNEIQLTTGPNYSNKTQLMSSVKNNDGYSNYGNAAAMKDAWTGVGTGDLPSLSDAADAVKEVAKVATKGATK